MGTTDVSICNSALIKLGADPIVSLEDDSRTAKLCKEQYPKLKLALLRSHPWNFAEKRLVIAADATAPAFGYTYRYTVPGDCLRVLEVNDNETEWKLENGYILSDSSDCKLRYIAEVSEERFEFLFSELLATALASDLSATINPAQKVTLLKQHEDILRLTRTIDAQENFPRQVQSTTLKNARR